jgi:hypothetical protein
MRIPCHRFARRLFSTIVLTVCFIQPAWSAVQPAGIIIALKGIVAVTPTEGESYFLEKSTSVYEGDVISSTKKSFAVVRFSDDSKVVIKADTVFKVEGYTFNDGENNTTLSLLKGGIRTVTGLIAKKNPDNYKLDTPVASLGVRGTDYDALLCDQECLEEDRPAKKRKPTPEESECNVKLQLDQLLPGAYFLVREGIVVLSRGEKEIAVGPGEVAFADEELLGCLSEIPLFLLDEFAPLPSSEDFRAYSPLQCSP